MRSRILLWLLALGIILVLLIAYFQRSPEATIARQIAARATTPEQRRLWNQAADRRTTTGLARVQRTAQPVQPRQPSTAASQPITPRGAGLIAPGVQSAVRILA